MKKRLSIQVQEDRTSEKRGVLQRIVRDLVCSQVSLVLDTGGVCETWDEPKVTTFVTPPLDEEELKAIWEVAQKLLSENTTLAETVITVCQGQHGWDDYLLLHHFDENEPVDSLLEIIKDITEEIE